MITVAVCTHNRAARLGETLEHLLQMELPPPLDWELLVVDNASTDETPSVVERFATRTDGRVRYVSEPRQGLSRARNAAVGAARGGIIAFTDDDVIPEPDWLAKLAETFRDYECAGVGGRVAQRWDFEPPDWWLEATDDLGAAIVGFDPGGGPRELDVPPFGANMAFRSEVFERHGGFRTDLGRMGKQLISGEDTEFGRRLLRAGEVLRYAPDAVVHHPVARERATKAYFRRWYYQYGRTVARRDGVPRDAPRILGVPRYLYRMLAGELLRMMLRSGSRRRFVHELRARRVLGTMMESRRAGNGRGRDDTETGADSSGGADRRDPPDSRKQPSDD